eukprot:CAMPEP_0197634520 /NCGR_PEP_ID=MMETSP1338-20131121/10589_1 /TAXON_ID=43686 ORGANISM="Pelagodinium beii, Strain RCC1491" /NCGR_SAMPLE_ID=MMETSP1338 /ASSEMBLY_ACC=CAM_ASM_000754 /LENGTH=110 /DNA_ID=CAMNT_0043206399 /DNA_START=26 /DNA_END=358 /DNA_ORIENTATION=-
MAPLFAKSIFAASLVVLGLLLQGCLFNCGSPKEGPSSIVTCVSQSVSNITACKEKCEASGYAGEKYWAGEANKGRCDCKKSNADDWQNFCKDVAGPDACCTNGVGVDSYQ